MATYTTAGNGITGEVANLIRKHHRELHDAEATYSVLFAHAERDKQTGEPKGPALKTSTGWPALAKVRVVSLRDRVAGLPDFQIILDGDQWEELQDETQAAILDHELEHVEVRRDDDGKIKSDDCGRPKLRLRPHDFEVAGFDIIVERHRENAVEAKACAALFKRMEQRAFEFMQA